ncbi:hypothetical protein HK098_003275 [Nowakowskiella sp. JEL0407]|nr:hypothetical protein HK098_003275 [Nowakowskiella sp. JEL0407]
MAATSAIDMSLDDYIKQNRKSTRVRGRGSSSAAITSPTRGGGAIRKKRGGSLRAEPYAKGKRVSGSGSAPAASSEGGIPAGMAVFKKINISNLANTVTQNDILDLFKHIGPIQSAQLFFDEKGRSKGTASVVFLKPGHAYRAHQEYHKRTLDNRPMNIELVLGDPTNLTKIAKPVSAASVRGGSSRGRGRGGRGRGGRGAGRGGRNTTLSADQLDKDMDTYMTQS